MPYPILAPNSTWFSQGGTTVKKSSITQIEVKNTYTPTGTTTSSWDASMAKDSSIMVYVEGTILTIAGNGTGKIYMNADSSSVFNGFSAMTAFVGADILDSSKVITLNRAFYDCLSVTSLNLNSWNTSNVENLYATFNGMLALNSLQVNNWNTSNVKDMTGAFQCCISLTELDLSGWTSDNVTTVKSMFSGLSDYGGAMSLTKIIGIENWKLSSCTDMSYMFENCTSFAELDVSKWDVSHVTTFAGTFGAQVGDMIIAVLDVSNWNTSSAINMGHMFDRCAFIVELDLSKWNTLSVTDMSYMFASMNNLQKITFGEEFSFTGNGSTSCVLPIPSATYITGADGNWYTQHRTPYIPADIPNRTAQTYYASLDIVNDLDFLVKNGSLLDVADNIRVLSGTENFMSPSNMVEYIGDANENIDYQNTLIAQIQSALQNKITGVKLPTLSNPAASTDLVYGKQLINQNGTVVTGSIIDAEEVVF